MKRIRKDAGDRYEYLQQLINEFYTSKYIGAKREVLANLANFAYNPFNYIFLRQLNVVNMFLDCLENSDEDIVKWAIAGLCNLAADPQNKELIFKNGGVPKIKSILHNSNPEVVISSLTTLIYLVSSFSLASMTEPDSIQLIKKFCNHDDPRIQNLAVIFMDDIYPKEHRDDAETSINCTAAKHIGSN